MELNDALDTQPRIGERAGSGQDLAYSHLEQAATEGADSGWQDGVRVGNVADGKRFGRVFLIPAHGRSPAEIRAEWNRRLGKDEAIETAEVTGQLGEIPAGRQQLLRGPLK